MLRMWNFTCEEHRFIHFTFKIPWCGFTHKWNMDLLVIFGMEQLPECNKTHKTPSLSLNV